MSERCPFCTRVAEDDVLRVSGLAVAIEDGYPVSPGHCLIVPRRHVPNLFALSDEEWRAVFDLLRVTQDALTQERSPDGFNVGVNAGEAAGQTVEHAHIHLIPRYVGDVRDPRGGVRWVLPGQAAYWLESG